MNYTWVHRTPLDVARAETEGLARLTVAEGLFRLARASGSVQSPILESPAPFNDLVGSWSASLPGDAAVEMLVSVRQDGAWSRWYRLGLRESGGFSSPDRQEDPAGLVDIDTLRLSKPADAFRYRLTLESRARKTPVLRQISVTVTDGAAPAGPPPFHAGPWVRELPVRARSQMTEQSSFRNDICSPTSLAMVLDFWGKPRKTSAVAEAVRDRTTGKFGVWPFNTAAAGLWGLEGHPARLDSLEDLQREISWGRPTVVSVAFGPGELAGAPIPKTKGHLLVVAGFTPQGDVIVRDPAAPDAKSARRVYARAEFHRAWRVAKKGLAYRLGKPWPSRMVVGAPVADLWAKLPTRKKASADDPAHLSQLLYGESVTALYAEGAWVRVLADEQPSFLPARRWQGYPGWVSGDALRATLPPPPDTVVRTRQALAHAGDEIITFSVGTRLLRLSQTAGQSSVRLLDGRKAELSSDALQGPPTGNIEQTRHQIVKTAELFLGTSYYWGGRSGVQADTSLGVDCSGLVNLSYRVQGLDIPRDAHEQWLKAAPRRRRDLKAGDLVFLTASARSRRVTHVMIYTGGDGLIESRHAAGRALRSSFSERFGRPLSALESGELVSDLSGGKPRRRRIHLGSYLE